MSKKAIETKIEVLRIEADKKLSEITELETQLEKIALMDDIDTLNRICDELNDFHQNKALIDHCGSRIAQQMYDLMEVIDGQVSRLNDEANEQGL